MKGDLATVGDELLKQGITAADFGDMNVFQQEALAKSLGMQANEMGDMLVKQESLSKLASATGNEEFKNMDKLVQAYKDGKITKEQLNKLGSEDLANQVEMVSLNEKFERGVKQLKEIFVQAIVPIIETVHKGLDGGFKVAKGILGVLNKIPGFGAFGTIVSTMGVAAMWKLFRATKGTMTNPMYTYNLNESSGGGGGDILDFVGGRKKGFGGGFRKFLGKGGYWKDMIKGGRAGTVARARSLRAITGLFTGKGTNFVGGTGANATKNIFQRTTGMFGNVAKAGKSGVAGLSKFGSLAKGAGAGLGLGILSMGVDALNDQGAFGKQGSAGSQAAGIGSWALTGAGIGALGGPIGAAIGAVAGGIVGAIDEFWYKKKREEDEMKAKAKQQDQLLEKMAEFQIELAKPGEVNIDGNKAGTMIAAGSYNMAGA